VSPRLPCAALALLAVAACAPTPPPAPARMVSAAPTGAVAPDAVTVELVAAAPIGLARARLELDLEELTAELRALTGLALEGPP